MSNNFKDTVVQVGGFLLEICEEDGKLKLLLSKENHVPEVTFGDQQPAYVEAQCRVKNGALHLQTHADRATAEKITRFLWEGRPYGAVADIPVEKFEDAFEVVSAVWGFGEKVPSLAGTSAEYAPCRVFADGVQIGDTLFRFGDSEDDAASVPQAPQASNEDDVADATIPAQLAFRSDGLHLQTEVSRELASKVTKLPWESRDYGAAVTISTSSVEDVDKLHDLYGDYADLSSLAGSDRQYLWCRVSRRGIYAGVHGKFFPFLHMEEDTPSTSEEDDLVIQARLYNGLWLHLQTHQPPEVARKFLNVDWEGRHYGAAATVHNSVLPTLYNVVREAQRRHYVFQTKSLAGTDQQYVVVRVHPNKPYMVLFQDNTWHTIDL